MAEEFPDPPLELHELLVRAVYRDPVTRKLVTVDLCDWKASEKAHIAIFHMYRKNPAVFDETKKAFVPGPNASISFSAKIREKKPTSPGERPPGQGSTE
jgi:hypothetical protein